MHPRSTTQHHAAPDYVQLQLPDVLADLSACEFTFLPLRPAASIISPTNGWFQEGLDDQGAYVLWTHRLKRSA